MGVMIGRTLLIRRTEWGARFPRSVTALTPSYGTTAHWEGPHMGVFDHSECAGKVRAIQDFHMDSQGWTDIAYTALCCPHGYAFEGRWVGVRTAANGTSEGNSQAYAVCYLSGLNDPFTDAAMRAERDITDFLDQQGGAGPGRNCHRDWKPTECPGDTICGWVRAGQPVPTPPPIPTPTSRRSNMLAICTRPDGSGVDAVAIGSDGRVWHWTAATPEGLEYATGEVVGDAILAGSISCTWSGDEFAIWGTGPDGRTFLCVFANGAFGPWKQIPWGADLTA